MTPGKYKPSGSFLIPRALSALSVTLRRFPIPRIRSVCHSAYRKKIQKQYFKKSDWVIDILIGFFSVPLAMCTSNSYLPARPLRLKFVVIC
jgi:hypothetical protein